MSRDMQGTEGRPQWSESSEKKQNSGDEISQGWIRIWGFSRRAEEKRSGCKQGIDKIRPEL